MPPAPFEVHLVQVDLTLTYNTTNPTSAFSRTLSSAIARVSAATFDSNLIPGSNIYDIGTTASPWKDLYVSGKVGIRTTNPSQALDVAGIANVQNYLNTSYFIATSTTATSTLANGISLSGGCFLYNNSCLGAATALATGNTFVGNSSNAATATSTIYLSTASNVGIGTTNPSQILDVAGIAKVQNYLTTSYFTATSTTATSTLSTGGLAIGTSQFVVQQNSGNVGIASTTPWGLLSVNPNGITGPAFVVGSSTATNLIVTNGGNVGIGTTNPANRLSVAGIIESTTGGIKFPDATTQTTATSYKVGNFSRDLATAAGSQTVTGIGFTPKAVILIASLGTAGAASWGFYDGTTNEVMFDNHNITANAYNLSFAISIYITQSAGNQSYGTLTSFNSDGFVVAWTKAGSPSGTLYINYIAFK